MNFTIENLINSLATVLTAQYSYPVYSSPNQQGTDFPCFFIFLMPSTVAQQVDNRYYRDLGIDIIFVQQRNIVNGYAEIQAIQDYLDTALETFTYTDGTNTTLIHTYERQASTEDDELHYQFHIRQRVSLPYTPTPMEEMEANNVNFDEG